MLKPLLLILKIITAFTVAITGILGIIGKSTDEIGNLTPYGKINLYILVFALVIAVVTYIVEYFNDEKKERQEQKLLAADIARQNKILIDIQRSFYTINSVDILIHIDIPANSHYFFNYKKKLNEFLDNYSANKEEVEKVFDKKTTSVILNTDSEMKAIHPVYSVVIKDDSPLFPKEDFFALTQLSPVFHILLTESIEFKELHNPPKQLPIPDLNLKQVCDMVIFAPTLYENHKSSISYSPTNNTFSVVTRTEKAIITHDNGKIISILDLPNKYLVLYSGTGRKDFELKELRIQFNKSESKNCNSLLSISQKQCQVIEGQMWKALAHKLLPKGKTNDIA